MAVGALALLVWALFGPTFRDAEGALDGRTCLAFGSAAAFFVLAATTGSQWRAFGRWMALAVVGQTASLQLIDAGPRIHYQHYRLGPDLFQGGELIALAILVGQTGMVLLAWLRRSKMTVAWLRGTRNAWRLLAAVLFSGLISAPLSRHVQTFAAELCFATFILVINLATVILMAAALPRDTALSAAQRVLRALRVDEVSSSGSAGIFDGVVVAASVWVTVLAATLSLLSYGAHPHVQDEVAYYLQARLLTHGALTGTAPLVLEPFQTYLIWFDAGRWFGCMPPGFPAFLAMGMAVGLPWLINPLLGGLNVILIGALLGELYDRRTARLAVLMLCVSPWAMFLSMSFMSHTLALSCAVFAALSIARARRTGRSAWGWGAGIALGLLSLVRPLDAVVMAVLLGLWALGVGGARLKAGALAGLALGTVFVGALNYPCNLHLTGKATETPVMAYMNATFGPNSNALGFGPNRGASWPLDPFPGHGWRDVIVNSQLNLFSINVEFLGWSTGSLLLVAALLFRGAWRGQDALMLALIAGVVGAHALYWFNGGPDFGARYWYLILVPCLVLTVRGMESVAAFFERIPAGITEVRERIIITFLVLCLMTVVNYLPWRAIDKYHHYLGMRPDIRELARRWHFGRSLVLVRGDEFPDYASAVVYGSLGLDDGRPVYARDLGEPLRSAVLRSYADRPVWIVNGPSVTGRGYEVVAGPLKPEVNVQSAFSTR